MRHDWIFDVLRDLKVYAQSNGLQALALKADEALRVARAEIVVYPGPDQGAVSGADLAAETDVGASAAPAERRH